jgi:hypothetical protein
MTLVHSLAHQEMFVYIDLCNIPNYLLLKKELYMMDKLHGLCHVHIYIYMRYVS